MTRVLAAAALTGAAAAAARHRWCWTLLFSELALLLAA